MPIGDSKIGEMQKKKSMSEMQAKVAMQKQQAAESNPSLPPEYQGNVQSASAGLAQGAAIAQQPGSGNTGLDAGTGALAGAGAGAATGAFFGPVGAAVGAGVGAVGGGLIGVMKARSARKQREREAVAKATEVQAQGQLMAGKSMTDMVENIRRNMGV